MIDTHLALVPSATELLILLQGRDYGCFGLADESVLALESELDGGIVLIS
jgi:hypothetical protein